MPYNQLLQVWLKKINKLKKNKKNKKKATIQKQAIITQPK